MGYCTMCSKETNLIVNDNIGGTSYLCEKCQRLFELCPICNEFYLGEELAENGLCDNCNKEQISENKL